MRHVATDREAALRSTCSDPASSDSNTHTAAARYPDARAKSPCRHDQGRRIGHTAAMIRSQFAAACLAAAVAAQDTALRPEVAARFAALALDCVHREYPTRSRTCCRGTRTSEPPAGADPGVLGLLRLALGGARALAPGAAGLRTFPEAPFAARLVPPWPLPDGGAHRRRGAVHGGRGPLRLRAPSRPGLAAAARGRAAERGTDPQDAQQWSSGPPAAQRGGAAAAD